MTTTASMSDFAICKNCGLAYSVTEHTTCNHCNFNIKEY